MTVNLVTQVTSYHEEQDSESVNPAGIAIRDGWALVALALILPMAVAAALIPGRTHLDAADNALVLVVVIVAVATTGRRTAAVLAALASALAFDFFLTRPYESFRISSDQNLITELLLLVVGLAVGELAARGRAHRADASARTSELALLHSVTELAASGRDSRVVIGAAEAELHELLGLKDCTFTRRDPGPIAARVTPEGDLTVGEESWNTADLGLPTKRVDLPVRGGGWLVGHFVLTPSPGRPVLHQQLVVAVTIADQVGASLLADGSVSANRS